MGVYQTKQRGALLDFFKEHSDQCFSIDQLAAQLPAHIHISRSALYRNVLRMAGEGLLQKSLQPGHRSKSLYQWISCQTSCPRIHLHCGDCGRIFHLGQPADEQALMAVFAHSGFQLDARASALPVLCGDCKQ